jgi:hypothetical protein
MESLLESVERGKRKIVRGLGIVLFDMQAPPEVDL